MPIHCFLSHSHRDKPVADQLANTLAAHGVETWYRARQILAADQWHDEIGKALERCDWFLLVFSTSAVNSHQIPSPRLIRNIKSRQWLRLREGTCI